MSGYGVTHVLQATSRSTHKQYCFRASIHRMRLIGLKHTAAQHNPSSKACTDSRSSGDIDASKLLDQPHAMLRQPRCRAVTQTYCKATRPPTQSTHPPRPHMPPCEPRMLPVCCPAAQHTSHPALPPAQGPRGPQRCLLLVAAGTFVCRCFM